MVPWSPWDDALELQLRSLLVQGLSAHDIAVELGHGLTRNAVLGKINRLGLSKPVLRKPPKEIVPRRRRNYVRRAVVLTPLPPPAPEQPPERAPEPTPPPRMRRLQLLSLMDHHCRFPIGDPRRRPFYFCGADAAEGKVYCEFHFRVTRAKRN